MLLSISFLAALVGVGFAGAAALLPDTGVDGTPGAYLAVLGAVAAALSLGLLVTVRMSVTARRALTVVAGVLAILTAMAAWFLMQNAVLSTMAVSVLALLFRGLRKHKGIFA